MIFVLSNVYQTFRRFVNSVTRNLDFLDFHIDNILVALSAVDVHIQHATLVFKSLLDHQIISNPDRCQLGRT